MARGFQHAAKSLWPHWQQAWLVHDDDDLVAVSKPAGLAVDPGAADGRGDALSRVSAHLDARLSMVHGLDRELSGLVVYAKSKRARKQLAAQMTRGVERRYVVVVAKPEPLLRDKRWTARIRDRDGHRTLVELTWKARSQPLRRALADAGAELHGDADGAAAWRIMAHVERLLLTHPGTGEPLELHSHLPSELQNGSDAPLLQRIQQAAQRRHALAHTDGLRAFRLVNGEGDGLPDMTLDLYDDYLVAGVGDTLPSAHVDAFLDAAHELGFRGLYLKRRPRKASTLRDTRRNDVAPPKAVRGDDAPPDYTIPEAGIAYPVTLGDGLSTGIFLDQRLGRQRVHQLSHGARVLNLFCYHGAFTVAAIAGGARSSVSIDSSAVAVAKASASLARLDVDPQQHRVEQAEALAWCQRRAQTRALFDLVILDPPSFSTVKGKPFRAARDYRNMAAAALCCVAPGGRLLASTNHRAIVRKQMRRWLELAASDARHKVTQFEILPDPIDFPPPPDRPCHLKTTVVHT